MYLSKANKTLGQNPFEEAYEGLRSWWSDEPAAIAKVRRNANFNAVTRVCDDNNQNCKDTYPCRPPLWFGKGSCYDYNEVKEVIRTYVSLVNAGTIPEYDRANNPQSIEGIENEVAKKSNRNLSRVETILWELYWGSLSNQVTTNKYIFPKSEAESEKHKNTPADCDIVCQAVKVAKTAMIIGLVGLTGATGFYLYKKYKTVKSVVKSKEAPSE